MMFVSMMWVLFNEPKADRFFDLVENGMTAEEAFRKA